MIKKLREKLKKNGQTLKWWHGKHLKNECKYSYFIKQVNDPDCMQDNVENAIAKFLKRREDISHG